MNQALEAYYHSPKRTRAVFLLSVLNSEVSEDSVCFVPDILHTVLLMYEVRISNHSTVIASLSLLPYIGNPAAAVCLSGWDVAVIDKYSHNIIRFSLLSCETCSIILSPNNRKRSDKVCDMAYNSTCGLIAVSSTASITIVSVEAKYAIHKITKHHLSIHAGISTRQYLVDEEEDLGAFDCQLFRDGARAQVMATGEDLKIDAVTGGEFNMKYVALPVGTYAISQVKPFQITSSSHDAYPLPGLSYDIVPCNTSCVAALLSNGIYEVSESPVFCDLRNVK
eukprot:PhF_6_TR30759/c0_g1_i2/m.45300